MNATKFFIYILNFKKTINHEELEVHEGKTKKSDNLHF